jgi:hypothetical protein
MLAKIGCGNRERHLDAKLAIAPVPDYHRRMDVKTCCRLSCRTRFARAI